MSAVPRETEEKLRQYHMLLLKWQKAINLISPGTIQNAWERHFQDSMQLADHIPEDARTLIDLGSGAGFPGLVLAMMRPELNVSLIESDQKKCEFLKAVSRETKTSVTVHNERIEAIAADLVPDAVTARALADLSSLLGFCADWAEANPNLTLLFLKGQKAEEEIESAKETFDFDCESIPSVTDGDASILKITQLRRVI